jgi:glutaredoxin
VLGCEEDRVRVTVLYFEDCPNWKMARRQLQDALVTAELADCVEVSYQRVETPEEAERVGFRGSPTILVDGRDPWAALDAPIGLSCRIYRTELGADGSPSVAQLVEALTE